jgi:hypothetical protein
MRPDLERLDNASRDALPAHRLHRQSASHRLPLRPVGAISVTIRFSRPTGGLGGMVSA